MQAVAGAVIAGTAAFSAQPSAPSCLPQVLGLLASCDAHGSVRLSALGLIQLASLEGAAAAAAGAEGQGGVSSPPAAPVAAQLPQSTSPQTQTVQVCTAAAAEKRKKRKENCVGRETLIQLSKRGHLGPRHRISPTSKTENREVNGGPGGIPYQKNGEQGSQWGSGGFPYQQNGEQGSLWGSRRVTGSTPFLTLAMRGRISFLKSTSSTYKFVSSCCCCCCCCRRTRCPQMLVASSSPERHGLHHFALAMGSVAPL